METIKETAENMHNKLATDTESIKLSKLSKSYNWEIKILGIDIERLIKLNNRMQQEFGGQYGTE